MRPFLLALGLAFLALPPVRADIDPALREDGVLYFEDNLPDTLAAPVKAPTTLYLRRDFTTPLAFFVPGQRIEIVGMSPQGYLVKGDYRGNSVTGWIATAQLPPGVDPKLIEQAQKNQKRHDLVAAAIKEKKVLRGMTPDEVRQSLGQPDQTSSRDDAQGRSLTWVFTTYSIVYQTVATPSYYGRSILQTIPTKVPTGQQVVTFTDGAVTAIEKHDTSPNSPSLNGGN